MVPKVLPISRTSLSSKTLNWGSNFPLEDVDVYAELEFRLFGS